METRSAVQSLSSTFMGLISPFAAAVAVATTAVSLGFALWKLCKDCAKAEKEIFGASQDLKNRHVVFGLWKELWARKLCECRSSHYSDIWGHEAYKAITDTVSVIQGNYNDVRSILESCKSPRKTGKTRARGKGKKMPFFFRVFYPDCFVRTGDRNVFVQSTHEKLGEPLKMRRKIQWCTSIRIQVNDLLAKIKDRQHDITTTAQDAFEQRCLAGRQPIGRLLPKELTVSRAIRRFYKELHSRHLVAEGHALIRVRRKTLDSNDPMRAGLPVELPFISIPKSTLRPRVFLAEIGVHSNPGMCSDDGLEVKLQELPDTDVSEENRQSLVKILSNHPNTRDFITRLRRVQMALTICISIFDFYGSDWLPVNMSIADIYSYKHRLLSRAEWNLPYPCQLYVTASCIQDYGQASTPFDYMYQSSSNHRPSNTYNRVSHAQDALLHRLGIILFEIGRGEQYERIFTERDHANHDDHADMVNRHINQIHICDQYKDLVRKCLGGSLGVDAVHADQSNSARPTGLRILNCICRTPSV